MTITSYTTKKCILLKWNQHWPLHCTCLNKLWMKLYCWDNAHWLKKQKDFFLRIWQQFMDLWHSQHMWPFLVSNNTDNSLWLWLFNYVMYDSFLFFCFYIFLFFFSSFDLVVSVFWLIYTYIYIYLLPKKLPIWSQIYHFNLTGVPLNFPVPLYWWKHKKMFVFLHKTNNSLKIILAIKQVQKGFLLLNNINVYWTMQIWPTG